MALKSNSPASKPPSDRPSRTHASLVAYLLGDTSISKAISNKNEIHRLNEKVIANKHQLKTQKIVRKVVEQRRILQESWDKCLENEIKVLGSKNLRIEKAAIKIQKFVKGFLVRLKYDPIILEHREKTSCSATHNLMEHTLYCMLTLGSSVLPAVKKIQTEYKRYLFRKKIYFMKVAYSNYLKAKEEKALKFLKESLVIFLSRLKRYYFVFLRYRAARLEEIKRKLSILKIKKYWKAKKLTVKILKEKIIKIKKRKEAMQNREALQKYLASFNGKKEALKKSESAEDVLEKDHDENVEETKEKEEKPEKIEKETDEKEKEREKEEEKKYKEAQAIKAMVEKKIKEKVDKSKLSYGLEFSSNKVILPIMQEKAINENLDVDSITSKLFYLTCSVFAKGRVLSRESPKKQRNTQIMSPRPVTHRKYYEKPYLPPLSNLTLPEVPIAPSSTRTVKWVEDEHFLNTTVSATNKSEPPVIPQWKLRELERLERKKQRKQALKNKIEEKPVQMKEFKIPERKNKWIPVARRFSMYVPGIDNSAYIPMKWSPLELDKRILAVKNPIGPGRRLQSEEASPNSIMYVDRKNYFYSPTGQNSRYRNTFESGSPSTQTQSIDTS